MPQLFERTAINGLQLNNRFIRSATWEGMAREDGACTAQLEQLYATLAEGRIGLIISSHAYVTRAGQATPWQLGIYHDDLVAPLASLTAAVHRHHGRIVVQLAHAGCLARRELTGRPPLRLSVRPDSINSDPAADIDALQRLPERFAQAARRAQAAGFDGIQLHAAHGYLLSQSLSPAFNRRTDHYGGSLENRSRLLLEVLSAVRRQVGNAYPVLVKLNCADFLEEGLTLEDSLQIGEMLQAGGIDAIEVSGGALTAGNLGPIRPNINSQDKEAYFRKAAATFKRKLTVPIMLVGGLRSLSLAETLLAEGSADYFSMSRPFIREPHLIRRWQNGDTRKATCISDNLCQQAARSGAGLYCVVEQERPTKQH